MRRCRGRGRAASKRVGHRAAAGIGRAADACAVRAFMRRVLKSLSTSSSPSMKQQRCWMPQVWSTGSSDKAKSSALVFSDRKWATGPEGMHFGPPRRQALITVKRATMLLRFDWLTGLIGALLRWLWSRECALQGLALPGFCPGGAEVVRRMASHNFRGPHDQIKIQSLDSLGCANDQQV